MPDPSWEAWLDGGDSGPSDRGARLLTAVWPLDQLADELPAAVPAGRPVGVPPREVLRAAGRELEALVRTHPRQDGGDPARLLLARQAVLARPARDRADGRPHPEDEVSRHADLLLATAGQLATDHPDDPFLTGLDRHRAAVAARAALRAEEALDAALDAVRRLTVAAEQPIPSAVSVALAGVPGAGPLDALPAAALAFALQAVAANARAVGRYEDYQLAVQRHGAVCAVLEDGGRPDLAARAIAARAVFGRVLGDRSASRAAENRLERLWVTGRRPDVRRLWLEERAQNATYLGDRSGSRALRRERIRAVAEHLGMPLAEVGPSAAADVVAACAATGAHAACTSVGNAAYDIARSLYEQDRTTDPAVLAEARSWCEVAEQAFVQGLNGRAALVVMRARLDAVDPAAARAPDEVVSDLLATVPRLAQITSRVGALIEVAQLAGPGDERVPAALLPVAERAIPRDRGQLLAVLAEWQLRRAEAPEEVARAAEWGAAAAEALSWDSVCLAPSFAARALLVVARAEQRLAAPPEQELRSLLRAVSCLAVQLTSAGSPRDRALLGRLFVPALRRASALAIGLADHRAADILFEVARRDRVGALLLELATTPELSDRLRQAAEDVLAAQAATPPAPGG
ncbi:hypothetical protein [Blastococcus sp. SYSU DS1021]